MFSHNSVNFKLKNSLSISPTNEVWIFMYKFIDFDHFQPIKENDIFRKIMWFLLFLYTFFKFLVAGLLLQFVAESIRLVWIKWLKSLFREAENDSYYRMLLSWLFSKRMLSDQNAFGGLDGNAFPSSFVRLLTLSRLEKP